MTVRCEGNSIGINLEPGIKLDSLVIATQRYYHIICIDLNPVSLALGIVAPSLYITHDWSSCA
jgi:hypothetical protein